MVGDAHRTTVGDYVTLVRGTTYKGALVGQPGPALLGLGSIEPGGGFRIGNYKTYGGDCPEELMLFPGDIYASLKGATKDGKMIGSVARVPPSVPAGRLTQDTVKLVFRDRDPALATCLYWVLRTPQYRAYCAGRAMGSAVVALSRRDFLSYSVPPLTTQRKMVITLLDAIEAKIELNRRMNETLEAMARALFKSWFVDFDPVHAKAEGRDPGLPKPLADFFPDSFEDSELGEIPTGWSCSHLGDVTEKIGSGATPRGGGSVYVADGAALIRSQNVYDSLFVWDGLVRISDTAARGLKGVTVEREDVLLNITGASILRTCVVDPDVLPARVNQHVCIIRPKRGIPARYVHCHLLQPSTKTILLGMDAGASRQAVTKGHIESVPLVIPPEAVLGAFADLVNPLFVAVRIKNAQSRSAAWIRDTLLPRLLSGEFAV